jgi:AcrR family transcriptional regulator
MATRRYEQRLRAQGAEETRRRILDAVDERLREAPTEPVSVDRLARMAGVARSTVYLIFGSRSGLFEAFAEHLWGRAGFDRLVENVALPATRENILGNVRIGSEIWAADRDVFRALYSMSQLDPDAVGGAIQLWEERRARGMTAQAGRMAYDGLLRPGMTQEQAAHLLWVYTSFDVFDLLYAGRGMSVDEVADVLVDMYERSVLAPPS